MAEPVVLTREAGYVWTIALPVRYAYREGMAGPDVAALQLNLRAKVDGFFGPGTEDEVVAYQEDQNLPADGIAGARTMQRLVVQASRGPTDRYRLPDGLLKSFASSESSFLLGAASRHPSDAGWDVGPFQISSGEIPSPSQEFLRNAYDAKTSADFAGRRAREEADDQPPAVPSRYLTELAGGDRDRFRWMMVALNHNWPVAAFEIPRRGSIYSNPATDDEPAAWISKATNGRLETPRQWVGFQVRTKTVYL